MVACDHPVFGGKALCKVTGVQNLGAGRKFIVPLPHQDFHRVGAEKGKCITCVSVGNGFGPQLFTGCPEGRQPGAEGEGCPGQTAAGKGLDVQFPPGHLPKGFPRAGICHLPGLQQAPQKEGLRWQAGRQPPSRTEMA